MCERQSVRRGGRLMASPPWIGNRYDPCARRKLTKSVRQTSISVARRVAGGRAGIERGQSVGQSAMSNNGIAKQINLRDFLLPMLYAVRPNEERPLFYLLSGNCDFGVTMNETK